MEIRVQGLDALPVAAEDEQKLLSLVWQEVWDTAEWPSFGHIDRRLDRQDVDAGAVLRAVPNGLMRGFPDRNRIVPSDDDLLALTIAGAARCPVRGTS